MMLEDVTRMVSALNRSRADTMRVTAVRKCVMMLEDVTRMVSALDLFSRNESIEEVSTQSVKFFLLPFLLGNLNAKLSNDLEQRLEVIRVVQTYYMDFLRRVKDYGIVSHQLPDVTEDEEEAGEDSSQRQRPGPPN